MLTTNTKFIKTDIDPNRGTLTAISHELFPFKPVRTFVISNTAPGIERGNHAHRTCRQYLVVANGTVKVSLQNKDGLQEYTIHAGSSLLIEPLTWATQKFLTQNTVLIVFCSESYNRAEYIESHGEFLGLMDDLKNAKG
jgi:dTDP-4-dehydrorhamnose 3,5-epimerase-like enzyme